MILCQRPHNAGHNRVAAQARRIGYRPRTKRLGGESKVNIYSFLSNLVLLVHFAFVTFIVGGLIVIWIGYLCGWSFVRSHRFRLAHVLAMAVVLIESLLGMVCPLTLWEDQLRMRAGQEQNYGESFMQHWVGRILFYDLGPGAFTVLYIIVFSLIVLTFWLVPPRKRSAPPRRACEPDRPIRSDGP